MLFKSLSEAQSVAVSLVKEELNRIHKRYNLYDKEHLVMSLEHSTFEIMLSNFKELQDIFKHNVLEINNGYTFEHSVKVATMAVFVAIFMGLTKDEIDGICKGCLLHDYGKMFLDYEVIHKNTTLNENDILHLRKHCMMGFNYFINNPDIPIVSKQIILNHHENLDGTGYPRGLTIKSLNFSTQLCSLCDVYDALASDRPYRSAVPSSSAVTMMKKEIGVKFDKSMFLIIMRILCLD